MARLQLDPLSGLLLPLLSFFTQWSSRSLSLHFGLFLSSLFVLFNFNWVSVS
jgi:hypothetical protein